MLWNGVKIRELRSRLGMNRSDFATLVRVKPITLRFWETDHIKPKGPATYVLDDLLERLEKDQPLPLMQPA